MKLETKIQENGEAGKTYSTARGDRLVEEVFQRHAIRSEGRMP